MTFHNSENGFCVLRTKARGRRDLITVVGHGCERGAQHMDEDQEWDEIRDRLSNLAERMRRFRDNEWWDTVLTGRDAKDVRQVLDKAEQLQTVLEQLLGQQLKPIE